MPATEILRGLQPFFEKHHSVSYTADAIKSAVTLSARYINDRKLPDKAIDEAGDGRGGHFVCVRSLLSLSPSLCFASSIVPSEEYGKHFAPSHPFDSFTFTFVLLSFHFAQFCKAIK